MKLEGLPVVDATKAVTIHITTKDVKNGGTKSPGDCAAARACVRDLHVKEARVFVSRVYIRRANHWVRYVTPASLRTEIVAFDRGGKFEAGDYCLPPVSPSMALGIKRSPKKRRVNASTRQLPRHVTVGIRPSAKSSMKGDAK